MLSIFKHAPDGTENQNKAQINAAANTVLDTMLNILSYLQFRFKSPQTKKIKIYFSQFYLLLLLQF